MEDIFDHYLNSSLTSSVRSDTFNAMTLAFRILFVKGSYLIISWNASVS